MSNGVRKEDDNTPPEFGIGAEPAAPFEQGLSPEGIQSIRNQGANASPDPITDRREEGAGTLKGQATPKASVRPQKPTIDGGNVDAVLNWANQELAKPGSGGPPPPNPKDFLTTGGPSQSPHPGRPPDADYDPAVAGGGEGYAGVDFDYGPDLDTVPGGAGAKPADAIYDAAEIPETVTETVAVSPETPEDEPVTAVTADDPTEIIEEGRDAGGSAYWDYKVAGTDDIMAAHRDLDFEAKITNPIAWYGAIDPNKPDPKALASVPKVGSDVYNQMVKSAALAIYGVPIDTRVGMRRAGQNERIMGSPGVRGMRDASLGGQDRQVMLSNNYFPEPDQLFNEVKLWLRFGKSAETGESRDPEELTAKKDMWFKAFQLDVEKYMGLNGSPTGAIGDVGTGEVGVAEALSQPGKGGVGRFSHGQRTGGGKHGGKIARMRFPDSRSALSLFESVPRDPHDTGWVERDVEEARRLLEAEAGKQGVRFEGVDLQGRGFGKNAHGEMVFISSGGAFTEKGAIEATQRTDEQWIPDYHAKGGGEIMPGFKELQGTLRERKLWDFYNISWGDQFTGHTQGTSGLGLDLKLGEQIIGPSSMGITGWNTGRKFGSFDPTNMAGEWNLADQDENVQKKWNAMADARKVQITLWRAGVRYKDPRGKTPNNPHGIDWANAPQLKVTDALYSGKKKGLENPNDSTMFLNMGDPTLPAGERIASSLVTAAKEAKKHPGTKPWESVISGLVKSGEGGFVPMLREEAQAQIDKMDQDGRFASVEAEMGWKPGDYKIKLTEALESILPVKEILNEINTQPKTPPNVRTGGGDEAPGSQEALKNAAGAGEQQTEEDEKPPQPGASLGTKATPAQIAAAEGAQGRPASGKPGVRGWFDKALSTIDSLMGDGTAPAKPEERAQQVSKAAPGGSGSPPNPQEIAKDVLGNEEVFFEKPLVEQFSLVGQYAMSRLGITADTARKAGLSDDEKATEEAQAWMGSMISDPVISAYMRNNPQLKKAMGYASMVVGPIAKKYLGAKKGLELAAEGTKRRAAARTPAQKESKKIEDGLPGVAEGEELSPKEHLDESLAMITDLADRSKPLTFEEIKAASESKVKESHLNEIEDLANVLKKDKGSVEKMIYLSESMANAAAGMYANTAAAFALDPTPEQPEPYKTPLREVRDSMQRDFDASAYRAAAESKGISVPAGASIGVMKQIVSDSQWMKTHELDAAKTYNTIKIASDTMMLNVAKTRASIAGQIGSSAAAVAKLENDGKQQRFENFLKMSEHTNKWTQQEYENKTQEERDDVARKQWRVVQANTLAATYSDEYKADLDRQLKERQITVSEYNARVNAWHKRQEVAKSADYKGEGMTSEQAGKFAAMIHVVDSLDEIAALRVQNPEDTKTGPMNDWIHRTQRIFGKGDVGYEQFRSYVQDVFNSYVFARTGKVLSQHETDRLKDVIPRPGHGFEMFDGMVAAFRANMVKDLRTQIKAQWARGVDVSRLSTMMPIMYRLQLPDGTWSSKKTAELGQLTQLVQSKPPGQRKAFRDRLELYNDDGQTVMDPSRAIRGQRIISTQKGMGIQKASDMKGDLRGPDMTGITGPGYEAREGYGGVGHLTPEGRHLAQLYANEDYDAARAYIIQHNTSRNAEDRASGRDKTIKGWVPRDEGLKGPEWGKEAAGAVGEGIPSAEEVTGRRTRLSSVRNESYGNLAPLNSLYDSMGDDDPTEQVDDGFPEAPDFSGNKSAEAILEEHTPSKSSVELSGRLKSAMGELKAGNLDTAKAQKLLTEVRAEMAKQMGIKPEEVTNSKFEKFIQENLMGQAKELIDISGGEK